MCRSGPASEEKPDRTIWASDTAAVPATCLSLSPSKVPERVLVIDCDIAGEGVAWDISGAEDDCDIADPGCISFELLQAARARTIVSRAAPLSSVDRMWFTFRFARDSAFCGRWCLRYKANGGVGDVAALSS